jgi:hypothetical protein
MATHGESVITKVKSKLLEPSPVFEGLTFENDEKTIIDVKQILKNDTKSAIELLSHEAKIKKTTDPTFNKMLGKKMFKNEAALLPRFDPFPNSSSATLLKIKKKEEMTPKDKNEDDDSNKNVYEKGNSPMIDGILVRPTANDGKNRPSSSSSYTRRKFNKISSDAKIQNEPIMYVDLLKLKAGLETSAFPLYGCESISKTLIEQMLYCSQIHDYSQKLVNEYSGQFVKLMSTLFLTFGGSDEANASALSVGKALLQLSHMDGFQSVLVENDSILPACIGILLGGILPVHCKLWETKNWSSIRGYDLNNSARTTLNYKSRISLSLDIINRIISKQYQKYIKASKVWKKLILLGGVFETLLLLASDDVDSFFYSSSSSNDAYADVKKYNKNKGRTRVNDLCKRWLNGFPTINKTSACDDENCKLLHLVGIYNAGKGYDKTGKQCFPELLSKVQIRARELLSYFSNEDFNIFLKGLNDRNKVNLLEEITTNDDNNNNGNHSIDDKSKNIVLLDPSTTSLVSVNTHGNAAVLRKVKSAIKLSKLKVRVALDLPEVHSIVLKSFKQQIEIRRRVFEYKKRRDHEFALHKRMTRDATEKKVNELIEQIKYENSKKIAHPIKAVHDANEFHENKKRLYEIYNLFMADRVAFRPCKYRTKLKKMIRTTQPHVWTTKAAAELWTREKYQVQNREKKWKEPRRKTQPADHRCQFCHRSMKDARKKSEWFLSAYDLGITFIEWIGAFSQTFLAEYFPRLAKKISNIRHAEKNADAMFEGLGVFLMKEKAWMETFGEPTYKNINGHTHTGYVDVKLLT